MHRRPKPSHHGMPMKRKGRDCLCLALDRVNRDRILHLTDSVRDHVGCFKINSAFVQYGPSIVRDLKDRQVEVFLDLKFHDIPATVAAHVEAAATLGVDWLTIHAGGGRAMMEAASETAHRVAGNGKRPRILAVTVLTSLDQQALNHDLHVPGPLDDHVTHLARTAMDCGVDGIVCSATDLPTLRERLPQSFIAVTPGISGLTTNAGADQKRTADPVSAIRLGATLLVIGRAILEAENPAQTAAEIRQAIENEIPSRNH